MGLDESVQNIAGALKPSNQRPSARWRWGTVESVTEHGTMNVNVGGTSLMGIRAAQHCMGAQVGDRVRVAYYGTDAVVDAVRASSALMSVPSPSMDADTQAAWLDALGFEFGESTVGEWGTWKWFIVGNLAVCEYENTNTRSIAATNQWGGLYYASLGSLSFPFEFATTPQVSGSIAESGNDFWVSFRSVSTTQIGNISALRVGSSTVNGKLCVTAIGRI